MNASVLISNEYTHTQRDRFCLRFYLALTLLLSVAFLCSNAVEWAMSICAVVAKKTEFSDKSSSSASNVNFLLLYVRSTDVRPHTVCPARRSVLIEFQIVSMGLNSNGSRPYRRMRVWRVWAWIFLLSILFMDRLFGHCWNSNPFWKFYTMIGLCMAYSVLRIRRKSKRHTTKRKIKNQNRFPVVLIAHTVSTLRRMGVFVCVCVCIMCERPLVLRVFWWTTRSRSTIIRI